MANRHRATAIVSSERRTLASVRVEAAAAEDIAPARKQSEGRAPVRGDGRLSRSR